jgi:hypothetical protein
MCWLLVILILIPQIVNAESAWVLWWKESVNSGSTKEDWIIGDWKPHAVFDTKKECIDDIYNVYIEFWDKEKENPKMQLFPKQPFLFNNRMNIVLQQSNRKTLVNLECWPSEIKPK